jgi:2Fe-2S ferredoxin
MLDMAYDLTKTSRLGCQVVLNDGLDGIVVNLPSAHHNLMD